MYRSPIELFLKEMPAKIKEDEEGLIVKACLDVGVNVDEDELKRLLKGDRDSYDRGYKDGYDAAIAKIMEALESDTF